jgi:DNA-binding transcriptional regulator YbjK
LSNQSVGEIKRQRILLSATKILINEGFAAVTHRSVAEMAGVPLGSTTYHFTDKSELILGALKHLIEEERIRRSAIEAPVNPSINQISAFLFEVFLPTQFRSKKKLGLVFERLVEASRNVEVKKLVAKDQKELSALVNGHLMTWGIDVKADLAQAVFDGRALLWLNSEQTLDGFKQAFLEDLNRLVRG